MSQHVRRRSGDTARLLDEAMIGSEGANPTPEPSTGPSTLTPMSLQDTPVRPSAWGLGALGRKRRIYCQILALLLLSVWVHFAWPRVEHVPSSASMTLHEKTSYILGSVTCPTPDRPHVPVDKPIASSYVQSCTAVPSLDPAFRVEVCPVKTTCNSFSVRITRTDPVECARLEGMEAPVDDEKLAAWLYDSKGPDSFFLRTDGAQRWVSEMSVYEGACTSRFDVTLSNGGPVWLELWWSYTEYAYFNERTKAWPENHFQPLLAAPLRLSSCPERCPMYHAPRLADAEMTFPAGTPLSPSDMVAGLADCPLDQAVQGLWLPRHPMDVVEPPVPVIPPLQGFQPLMGTYEYFRPTCQYRHGGTQFRFDHAKCTSKPKNVLFAGDSHGRYVMFHFKHRLDGHNETFSELSFDFWWSAREEYLDYDEKKLGEFDSVLFSYGAWELMGGTSVQEFSKRVETFLQMVETAQKENDPEGSRTRENVFLIGPPVPPRLTGFPKERADQRTNHRFEAYRIATLDLLQRYGWRVVDQFSIAMPVTLEINAVDGGHLTPGASHAHIVDEVIAKMGLC
ncbi:hypothetical protein IAU60_006777 [Kwoniella sp. DSM 27419]